MGKEKLHQIDERAKCEEVTFWIRRAIEAFYRVSRNVPNVMEEISKRIYGRFDRAQEYVFHATSGTFSKEEKLLFLHKAHECLFYQQTSFMTLIDGHGCTVGQANEVIDLVAEAYRQTDKLYNAIMAKE